MDDPNSQRSADHDLLIKLETKLDQVSVDIKDLKDGINAKVSDHESRLRSAEGKIATYTGGIVLFQFVAGVLMWYFSRG